MPTIYSSPLCTSITDMSAYVLQSDVDYWLTRIKEFTNRPGHVPIYEFGDILETCKILQSLFIKCFKLSHFCKTNRKKLDELAVGFESMLYEMLEKRARDEDCSPIYRNMLSICLLDHSSIVWNRCVVHIWALRPIPASQWDFDELIYICFAGMILDPTEPVYHYALLRMTTMPVFAKIRHIVSYDSRLHLRNLQAGTKKHFNTAAWRNIPDDQDPLMHCLYQITVLSRPVSDEQIAQAVTGLRRSSQHATAPPLDYYMCVGSIITESLFDKGGFLSYFSSIANGDDAPKRSFVIGQDVTLYPLLDFVNNILTSKSHQSSQDNEWIRGASPTLYKILRCIEAITILYGNHPEWRQPAVLELLNKFQLDSISTWLQFWSCLDSKGMPQNPFTADAGSERFLLIDDFDVARSHFGWLLELSEYIRKHGSTIAPLQTTPADRVLHLLQRSAYLINYIMDWLTVENDIAGQNGFVSLV